MIKSQVNHLFSQTTEGGGLVVGAKVNGTVLGVVSALPASSISSASMVKSSGSSCSSIEVSRQGNSNQSGRVKPAAIHVAAAL